MLEETEEFKLALKLVIKRQMRHLMEQLKEGGEEVVILSVNMMNKTCSHFGSSTGEWFISEQENLTNSFLNFCITHSKVNKVRANMTQSPGVAWDQRPYGLGRPQGSASPAATNVSVPVTTPVSTPVKHTPQIGQKPLAISIPKSMTTGVSEAELAGFVGRIVAAQISGAQKQTDLVQAAVNGGMSSECLASQSPPAKRPRSTQEGVTTRSTRSGRKVSAKYLEGISTIRSKSGKVKNTSLTKDASETMNQLGDINPDIGSRVEMKMAGKEHAIVSVAVENVGSLRKTVLPTPSELSQESADLYNVKTVQVAVDTESQTGRVAVSFAKQAEDEEDCGEIETSVAGEEDWYDNTQDKTDQDFEPPTAWDVNLGIKKAGSTVGVVHEPKRIRKPERPMPCDLCGVSIIGKSNLRSHIRRIHLGQKNHKCDVCSKFFWSGNDRDAHKLSVHTRKCNSCKEYVVESVPWEVGTNRRSRRDVLCACGEIVPIYSAYGCRLKSNKETDKAGNQGAMRQNDDGTKYACGTCGKLFMKKNMYEQHIRGHFSVKSCVCEICGISFTYENSLRKHKIKEHGQECLVCKYCNKNYSNPMTLNIHVSREHGKEALKDLDKYKNSSDGNAKDESQEIVDAAYKKDDHSKPKVVVKKMNSVYSSSAAKVKTKTGLGKGGQKRCIGKDKSDQLTKTTNKQEGEMDSGVTEIETTEQILLTNEDEIEKLVARGQGQKLEISHLVITSDQESRVMVSNEGVVEDSQVVVCEESFVNSLDRILRNNQVISEEGGVSINCQTGGPGSQ